MKHAVALAGLVCLGPLVPVGNLGQTVAIEPPPLEPPVFTSSHRLLDLLAIAEPSTIALAGRHPVAWVFEMCRRADAQNDNCPPGSRTFSPYGGIRLQLYPGDHLRIRLINRLPPVPPDSIYAHGSDQMMNEMLAANPVNIHTHGLVVEPRKADATHPTWGDYVYVLDYPAGKLPHMVSTALTATDQPLQYDIYIPLGHPSGFYWFHPHVHGLNINHLSEGLSGIITIGRVTDYASAPGGSAIPERYFVLKDMQVMGNGQVVDQEDSAFCAPFDYVQVQRNGSCQGRNTSGSDGDLRPPTGSIGVIRSGPALHHPGSTGADYTGGLWFFTVNGQVYPQLPAPSGSGELWRILNAGASRTYDLVLRDDQTSAPVPFQIVSLNGASLTPPTGTTAVGVRAPATNAMGTVPCQSQTSQGQAGPARTTRSAPPICATHLVMFPGARAEIWVNPQPHPATLLTDMVYTGPAGDRWPQANLAHIAAGQSTAAPSLLDVRPVPDLQPLERAISPANSHEAPAHPQQAAGCTALPTGHRRRIFFGVPSSNPNAYGLGYEEVDQNNQPVPGTFRDIAAFDPSVIGVCLPLGPHQSPVTEEWELVNVSAEAHNFHIHQARFYVLPQIAPAGDAGELIDNVSLPNGGPPCDGTVAKWRAGRCQVATVVVRIRFSQRGDFVYHCHIGEHEDSGMMEHIRVIASR
jgi:FtsP/CotA-like multicopper oxidase with cupredoxin domain